MAAALTIRGVSAARTFRPRPCGYWVAKGALLVPQRAVIETQGTYRLLW